MSTQKLLPESAIPGVSDVRAFTHVLDFVANREKYEDRIAELEAKTKAHNDAVTRVVALNAIGALQAKVSRDRKTAEDALVAAQDEAKNIREAAAEHADGVRAKVKLQQEALDISVAGAEQRLGRWEQELELREETTTAKKNASEEEMTSAEALHKKGQKLQERYENALAALKKITNEV